MEKKKDMLGWLNQAKMLTETRDELSTTLYLQFKIIFFKIKVMSRCLSVYDATSLICNIIPPK